MGDANGGGTRTAVLPVPGAVVRARRRPPLLGVLAALAAVALVGAGVAYLTRPSGSSPIALIRPSGIPADVSTADADVMALSPLPATPAPAFTLTDQTGATVPLATLRGKVVVLEAMDPHCTDICPIVSHEFVTAYHQLGAAASQVVFAALNVNQYFARPADVLRFSQENGLTAIPAWHFLTGSTPELQAAWRAYGVQVQAPNPDADIIHTSVLYFIDRQGVERYVASPMVDHTASGGSYLPASVQASWAQGIALIAKDLAGQSAGA